MLPRILGNLSSDMFGVGNTRETKNGYVAEIEVPGMTKADLTVEINEGLIEVRSKKGARKQIYEAFSIPTDTNSLGITAQVENGLLKIWMPKEVKQETKKTIEIK